MRKPKLRVYSICLDGKDSVVVAATSMAKAAELLKVSPFFFRRYCGTVGNEETIAMALQEPITPWRKARAFTKDKWERMQV